MQEGFEKVTRFEVIDHRAEAKKFGRIVVEYGVSVEVHLQDGKRTLKVFIDDPV